MHRWSSFYRKRSTTRRMNVCKHVFAIKLAKFSVLPRTACCGQPKRAVRTCHYHASD